MIRNALVAVPAVGLAVVLTGASVAPAAFTVEGKRVQGRPTSDGAPRLEPGQYVDQFPASTAEGSDLYYTIARSHNGSVLHVGLSTRPRSASSDRESVVLRLLTTDGLDCGYGQTQDNDYQVKRRNSVASATVLSWSPGTEIRKRCLTDGELILRVSPDPEAGRLAKQPFELTVTEEPAIYEGELPPLAEGPAPWSGMGPVSRPTSVAGGTSFNDARDLRTGSYESQVQPGETRFFKVPVGWGQTLQATARIQRPSGALRGNLDELQQTITLHLYGPTRGWATADSTTAPGLVGNIISFDEATLLSAMTLPVRYNNRRGEDHQQHAASLAGDYYVMVTFSEDKDGQRYQLPYELTVKVAGKRDGAPPYVTGHQVAGPGASQLAMTDIPSESEVAGEGIAGAVVPLAIAGAVLLLSGLVTLVVMQIRRSRRAEFEDRVVSEGR